MTQLIGIQTYDPETIRKFLPQLGIARHEVIFNPATTKDLAVMVQVGGNEVRTSHCYVQPGDPPFIQLLDPRTCFAEPINKAFILCGLSKAKQLRDRTDPRYTIVYHIQPTLAEVQNFLPFGTPFALDIETDPSTHEITTVGIAWRDGKAIRSMSIPFAVENQSYWSEAEEPLIWDLVSSWLASPVLKIMQNFIFDTMMFSRLGLHTEGPIADTMTIAHWIQPEFPKGLGDLARLYLFVDVWKNQSSWASNTTLWKYNAKDAAYTLLIYEKMQEILKHEKRWDFIETQLTPLSALVLRVCERGWKLNPEVLRDLKNSLEVETSSLFSILHTIAADFVRPKETYIHRRGRRERDRIYYVGSGPPLPTKALRFSSYTEREIPAELKKLSDYPEPLFEKKIEPRAFNPDSHPQLLEIFEGLGVKIPLKNGKKTLDELALLKIRDKTTDAIISQFVTALIDYRQKSKLISTYVDSHPDPDGIYRFSITIPGTIEARFSSSQTPWGTGFNSQNIPKSFRKLSIPHHAEHLILNMDFRAADPHMVAWLSGEVEMTKILESGGDLHSYTASAIYGRDITHDPDYKNGLPRKLGKACNNGLNYGMQVYRFLDTCREQGLELTLKEAQAAYDAYFRLYPGIRNWQNAIRQQVLRTRTLTTPFGRRRYFFKQLDDKTFNAAYAWIPPSTVADALNKGWLIWDTLNKTLGLRAEVLQQCHDSMKFQVHRDDLSALAQSLQNCYNQVRFVVNGKERCFPLEIEFGPNWGDLKPWKPS